MWRSSASAAMGISALAVSCRGALIASLGSGRRGGELGWPIAIGRTGVAWRRLIDEVVVQGGATASMVMAGREPAKQNCSTGRLVLVATRRGIEPGVPEQHLNHSDIDVLLEQVSGEAVPQGVERYALVDRGPIGCIEPI